MRPEIIPKAWGYEYCAFDNREAAVWVLHIAKGRRTSLHRHPNKATTLIAVSGTIRIQSGRRDSPVIDLRPLEFHHIPKDVLHRSECPLDSDVKPTAENGAWLLEVEVPSIKSDIVRDDDDYGRAGKPIESDGIVHKGPLLSLTDKWQSFMGVDICLSYKPLGDYVQFVGNEQFLCLRKSKTMKLSDYVAKFIADLGIKHVFGVAGGGSMHLVDSFGKHERIKYVATHHEQAAGMSADSYARRNGIGCALVTSGPGGTNAITAVCCSWVDSIPVIFLSGQVTRDTLLNGTGLRQFGVQETDITRLVEPITKATWILSEPENIRYALEYLAHQATTGRPGPVWLDIPLDVQSAQVDPEKLRAYVPDSLSPHVLDHEIDTCMAMLNRAKRPVLIVGNGCRNSKDKVRALSDMLAIPVVSSWLAADMIADDPWHIGHCGIFGDRASNFAVQNADLLLVLGCRLSVPQIGYNFHAFARGAEIIMVDIDSREIIKPSLQVDLAIIGDAGEFAQKLYRHLGQFEYAHDAEWLKQCKRWVKKYPVCLPEYADQKNGVNSFYFVDQLAKLLPDDATVVLDMATAFTCTYQAAKMKPGQRWITAAGHAPMGYALPGAVGAAFATGRKVIAIVGDGSLQMNLQELQTIVHNYLDITIFVLNNNGYLSIKLMQSNHFDRRIGSDPDSGLSCPDTSKIAEAHDIRYWCFKAGEELKFLGEALEKRGPMICEIMMDPSQPLIPRVASKKMPDGSVKSTPIEDMFPFLPRDEFNAAMIVKPMDVLE